ncbi:hypothetical protein ACOMHN_000547 [Nucella lapillus]
MADFLMGVYIAIIGAANERFRGRYLHNDDTWKNSVTCKVAGFLSLLSSEVSALIIWFITLDRFIVLGFPFSTVRFDRTSAAVACLLTWLGGWVLAMLPLLPVTSHWEFYSQTGICVPLLVTRRKFKGWAYSFSILIIFNFVIFIFVSVGQALIYWTVQVIALKTDSTKVPKDMAIAPRLITIAVTNFLCWFPIGLCGLLVLAGVPIPGDANVILAIVVLPLNSAINPFMYTVNTLAEKRRKINEVKLLQWLESNSDLIVNYCPLDRMRCSPPGQEQDDASEHESDPPDSNGSLGNAGSPMDYIPDAFDNLDDSEDFSGILACEFDDQGNLITDYDSSNSNEPGPSDGLMLNSHEIDEYFSTVENHQVPWSISSDRTSTQPQQAAGNFQPSWEWSGCSSPSEGLASREPSYDNIFSMVNCGSRTRPPVDLSLMTTAGEQVKALLERKMQMERAAARRKDSTSSSTSSSLSGPARRRQQRGKARARPVLKLKKWSALNSAEQLESMCELTNIISTQLGVRERFDAIKIIDPKCGISHTDRINNYVLDANVLSRLNNTRFTKLQRFVRLHASDWESTDSSSPGTIEQSHSQGVSLSLDLTNDAADSTSSNASQPSSFPLAGPSFESDRIPNKVDRRRRKGGGKHQARQPSPDSRTQNIIPLKTKDEQRKREVASAGYFVFNRDFKLSPVDDVDEDLDILS